MELNKLKDLLFDHLLTTTKGTPEHIWKTVAKADISITGDDVAVTYETGHVEYLIVKKTYTLVPPVDVWEK